ncbi:MAG: hypothetical protein JSW39_08525 [Desulfobacterales bacterium]|nr:MAG: hypothetical protein JSW39_08525 [Desulfobacterales bacterium]
MKDTANLHLKVQELCDCYATTDPLKEMSTVKNDADPDGAALKWLALAALHGVNNNAQKVSITRSKSGDIEVTAKYRVTELPSPGAQVGKKIIETVRNITHIEGRKGKTPLALGIRESSLELKIKIESTDDGEEVTIKFPE